MVTLIVALGACQPAVDVPGGGLPDATPTETGIVPLDAPRLLRRMSIDLRGRLPEPAELDLVAADPAAIDGLRDEYLDDPAFAGQVVRMFGERWLTLVDDFPIRTHDYGLDPSQEYAFERAVGEEPLRLLADVAASDRPWTDVVTADYTMADALLLTLWPLAPVDGEAGTGWVRARWTDDRPAVGVLASNGLWWRYPTSPLNYNRTRAAATLRLLLCDDLLQRQVSLAGSAVGLDEEGAAEAVRSDPGCVGCHSVLDPLATAYFGFWWYDQYDPAELTRYHPEREPLGVRVLEREGALDGVPIDGLYALGEVIADDPRFATCATATAAAALWRRDTGLDDFQRLTQARAAFEQGGMRFKALVRALTDGATYRAGGFAADATDDARARERPTRLLTSEQLADVYGALSGFVWEDDGFDLLRNDSAGFRTMAGGVDGVNVTRVQDVPGVTWTAVTRDVSVAVAIALVERDRAAGAGVFAGVDPDARPGSAAFDAALASVHWRLLATAPDAETLAEDAALWASLEALGGVDLAWAGVVAAILRDPLFLGY